MNLLPMATCGTLLSLICCTSTALVEGPAAPKLAPSQTLTVRLLDASGKPVSGAHVGSMSRFWRKFLKREAADKDGFMYIDHRVSDAKGIAQINFPVDEFQQLVQRRCLVARHAERGLIAVADLSPGMTQAPFDLTLVPECRVSRKALLCTELDKRGRKVGWTNVEIYVGRKRIMWCASEQDGDFHFFLPPGHYPGSTLTVRICRSRIRKSPFRRANES